MSFIHKKTMDPMKIFFKTFHMLFQLLPVSIQFLSINNKTYIVNDHIQRMLKIRNKKLGKNRNVDFTSQTFYSAYRYKVISFPINSITKIITIPVQVTLCNTITSRTPFIPWEIILFFLLSIFFKTVPKIVWYYHKNTPPYNMQKI